MHHLTVQTPSHQYPIYIARDILQNFDLLHPHIQSKVAIITNETIAPLYLKQLESLLKKNNMSKLFLKKARKIIFFLLFVI